MENASKALIIAGAILISILLISVGILVMNSTDDIQEGMQSEMSTTAVRTFNAKFEGYIGTHPCSTAKSLCSEVTASNANSPYQVTVNGKSSAAEIQTYAASLNSKLNYTIVIVDGDDDGYYDTITITESEK